MFNKLEFNTNLINSNLTRSKQDFNKIILIKLFFGYNLNTNLT